VQGIASDRQLAEVRRTLERAVGRACPSWLADRRDDIIQNALIRVTEILGRSEESEIRTTSYLWKVAYTATVNEIRRVRRQREDSVEPEILEHHNASSADPERESVSREIGEAIRGCLGDMLEPRRLAVLMHLYGYGLKKTAGVLGWVPKRADNLLYRGMADLRKCLVGKGIKP
jgi:RNA polymerase sigma-70 factor (ECF subfamily)